MKQPYIYTLPEGFINDVSVPLRWKLYALINGFWIAGKPVFASNEFFADKLKCTERHIQRSLEVLEGFNAIQRVGEGMHRRIVPYGTTSQTVPPRPQRSQKDDLPDRHISDSISDNLTISADAQIVEVSEKEEKPKSSPKYPNARILFKAVWGENYPRAWNTNTTQLIAAENLFAERGLEEARDAYRWYQKNKPRDFPYDLSTPHDLDAKYPKLEAYYDKQQ